MITNRIEFLASGSQYATFFGMCMVCGGVCDCVWMRMRTNKQNKLKICQRQAKMIWPIVIGLNVNVNVWLIKIKDAERKKKRVKKCCFYLFILVKWHCTSNKIECFECGHHMTGDWWHFHIITYYVYYQSRNHWEKENKFTEFNGSNDEGLIWIRLTAVGR